MQFREIHRDQIRRQLKHRLSHMDGIQSCYIISLTGFINGLVLTASDNHEYRPLGIIFIVISLFFSLLYLGFKNVYQKNGYSPELLKLSDKLIILLFLVTAHLFIPSSLDPSVVTMVTLFPAMTFGCWRIYVYRKPNLYRHYFLAGREYFRELKSYRRH